MSGRFELEHLRIPGLAVVRPTVHGDSRGFFLESFRKSDFQALGLPTDFSQDNHARSGSGVLRGLHYQIHPAEQGKLIRVLRGAVFDVAVDIRVGSRTFGQWEGVTLTEERQEMLYIPPGFAHGYKVLSDGADLVYKVTREYQADLDRGIRWDDPDLAIEWPGDAPVLSERDRSLPGLGDADLGRAEHSSGRH